MIYVGSKSFRENKTLMSELARAFPKDYINVEDCDHAHAAIIGLERIDEAFLLPRPSLRVISKYGVGVDNIDFNACERYWVKVLHTPGVNAKYVAEHTLGLMTSLLRNIYKGIRHVGRDWIKDGGQSFEGKKIGIIGYGNVGKIVAEALSNHEIYYNDLCEGVTKETIYRDCDIITLHVPLTPETKHLINAKTLAKMKPTAYLINTSRGGVVNQEDLKWALRKGVIAGAALDVFEHEPCNDEELLTMENVICTPHIAGNSEQAVLAMGRAAIENLKKALK